MYRAIVRFCLALLVVVLPLSSGCTLGNPLEPEWRIRRGPAGGTPRRKPLTTPAPQPPADAGSR